jgi:hypothetical protein
VQNVEHVLGKYIIAEKPMTEEEWIKGTRSRRYRRDAEDRKTTLGLNYRDYLHEAYRLVRYGNLEILLGAMTSCKFATCLPGPIHLLGRDKIIGAPPQVSQPRFHPRSVSRQQP